MGQPLSADKPVLAGKLATFFAYPADIRKVIYTTNAIEPLNSGYGKTEILSYA